MDNSDYVLIDWCCDDTETPPVPGSNSVTFRAAAASLERGGFAPFYSGSLAGTWKTDTSSWIVGGPNFSAGSIVWRITGSGSTSYGLYYATVNITSSGDPATTSGWEAISGNNLVKANPYNGEAIYNRDTGQWVVGGPDFVSGDYAWSISGTGFSGTGLYMAHANITNSGDPKFTDGWHVAMAGETIPGTRWAKVGLTNYSAPARYSTLTVVATCTTSAGTGTATGVFSFDRITGIISGDSLSGVLVPMPTPPPGKTAYPIDVMSVAGDVISYFYGTSFTMGGTSFSCGSSGQISWYDAETTGASWGLSLTLSDEYTPETNFELCFGMMADKLAAASFSTNAYGYSAYPAWGYSNGGVTLTGVDVARAYGVWRTLVTNYTYGGTVYAFSCANAATGYVPNWDDWQTSLSHGINSNYYYSLSPNVVCPP